MKVIVTDEGRKFVLDIREDAGKTVPDECTLKYILKL